MYFSRFAELKFKKIYFVNINAILMNRKFEKSDKIFETDFSYSFRKRNCMRVKARYIDRNGPVWVTAERLIIDNYRPFNTPS